MSKAQKAEKGTLKKVLNYLRPYWALVALSILLSAAVVGLTLYVPVLIGRAIDHIIGPGQVDFAAVLSLLTRIGVIVAATAGIQWLVNSINNKIAFNTFFIVLLFPPTNNKKKENAPPPGTFSEIF